MTPFLVFDFDGTLVDTAPDIVEATNRLLAELSLPPLSEEHVKINIGQGLVDLLYEVLPAARQDVHFKDGLVERFHEIYQEHYLLHPRLYDGIEEILAWPNPKAILSNKSSRYIHGILKSLRLDQVPWVGVIGGDTFATKKPEPEGIQYLMSQAGYDIHSTVLIGDGNPDADLAARTGVPMVAVEFGYGDIEELKRRGAQWQIGHYKHLRETLREIFPIS